MGSCSSKDVIANQRIGQTGAGENYRNRPSFQYQDSYRYRTPSVNGPVERIGYYNAAASTNPSDSRRSRSSAKIRGDSVSVSQISHTSKKKKSRSHSLSCCAPSECCALKNPSTCCTSQTQTEATPYLSIPADGRKSQVGRFSVVRYGQDNLEPITPSPVTAGKTTDGGYQLEFFCSGASVEAESFIGQDKDKTTHLVTRHIIRHPNCIHDPKKGELHIAILQKTPIDTTSSPDLKQVGYTAHEAGVLGGGNLLLDDTEETFGPKDVDRNVYSPQFIYMGYDPKRARQKSPRTGPQQKIPVVRVKDSKAKSEKVCCGAACVIENPCARSQKMSRTSDNKIGTTFDTSSECTRQSGVNTVAEPMVVPVFISPGDRHAFVASMPPKKQQTLPVAEDPDSREPEIVEQVTNNGSCSVSYVMEGICNINQIEDQMAIAHQTITYKRHDSFSAAEPETEKDTDIYYSATGSMATPVGYVESNAQKRATFHGSVSRGLSSSITSNPIVYTTELHEAKAVDALEEWHVSIPIDETSSPPQKINEQAPVKDVKRSSRRSLFELLTGSKRQESQTQSCDAKLVQSVSSASTTTIRGQNQDGSPEKCVREDKDVLLSQIDNRDKEITEVPANSDNLSKDSGTSSSCACVRPTSHHQPAKSASKEQNVEPGMPQGIVMIKTVGVPNKVLDVTFDHNALGPPIRNPPRRYKELKQVSRERAATVPRTKTFVPTVRTYSLEKSKSQDGILEAKGSKGWNKSGSQAPSFLPPINNNVDKIPTIDSNGAMQRKLKNETAKQGSSAEKSNVALPKLKQSNSTQSDRQQNTSNRNNHRSNRSSGRISKAEYDLLVVHHPK